MLLSCFAMHQAAAVAAASASYNSSSSYKVVRLAVGRFTLALAASEQNWKSRLLLPEV
jgi:hypothetical protein